MILIWMIFAFILFNLAIHFFYHPRVEAYREKNSERWDNRRKNKKD